MAYVRIALNDKSFQITFILLCDPGRYGGVLKLMKNGQLLSIFSFCGPFPQNFGQVLSQIILYFVKIV